MVQGLEYLYAFDHAFSDRSSFTKCTYRILRPQILGKWKRSSQMVSALVPERKGNEPLVSGQREFVSLPFTPFIFGTPQKQKKHLLAAAACK